MPLLIFTILPVILALVIAHNKGRSMFKAFLITFFFSWLGLFVILLLENRKPCPFCATKIPKAAIVCPKCNRDLTQ